MNYKQKNLKLIKLLFMPDENGVKLFKSQIDLIRSFGVDKSKEPGLRILLNQVILGKKNISKNLKELMRASIVKHEYYVESMLGQLDDALSANIEHTIDALSSDVNVDLMVSSNELLMLASIADILGKSLSSSDITILLQVIREK